MQHFYYSYIIPQFFNQLSSCYYKILVFIYFLKNTFNDLQLFFCEQTGSHISLILVLSCLLFTLAPNFSCKLIAFVTIFITVLIILIFLGLFLHIFLLILLQKQSHFFQIHYSCSFLFVGSLKRR